MHFPGSSNLGTTSGVVWSSKLTFTTLLCFSWVARFQTNFVVNSRLPFIWVYTSFCPTRTSARLTSFRERLHGESNTLLETTFVQGPCRACCTSQSSEQPQKVFDADWHAMGIHVIWNGVESKLALQGFMTRTSTCLAIAQRQV
jgi:hypothetical protein